MTTDIKIFLNSFCQFVSSIIQCARIKLKVLILEWVSLGVSVLTVSKIELIHLQGKAARLNLPGIATISTRMSEKTEHSMKRKNLEKLFNFTGTEREL